MILDKHFHREGDGTQVSGAAAAPLWVDDRWLEANTGIKRSTWQAWRVRGTGCPFSRIGSGARGLVRYDWINVVQPWLESFEVSSTSKYGARTVLQSVPLATKEAT